VPSSAVDQLLAQLQAISPAASSNPSAVNQAAGSTTQTSLSQAGSSLTSLIPPVNGQNGVLLPNGTAVGVPNPAPGANNLFPGTVPATPPTTPSKTASINQPGPMNPVSATLQQTINPSLINAQIQTASGAPVTNPAAAVAPTVPPLATPPAVSQAPNVSASIVTGEAIKNEVMIPTPTSNDLSNPQAISSAQFDASAKPITAEAVSPSIPTTEVTTNLTVSASPDKTTPNDALISQAAAPLLNVGASQSDKSNTVQTGALANNAMAANGNIESAQILNQISQQVAAQMEAAKTVSRLNFQLIPESLGRVTVQLALVDQAVSARIIVTNPDVREAIQTHLVDLKSALNQAGLQIDQLQVQVQGGSSNLLAQYYQYQQEGFGYRLPASFEASEGTQTAENTGVLGPFSTRNSLVNVLA
jgi:flagellar hook-length control protein FliK